MKNSCQPFRSFYVGVEDDHREKNVSSQKWLFKCLHIWIITKDGSGVWNHTFMPHVFVAPHTYFGVLCIGHLARLGQFLVILMILKPHSIHQNYVLHVCDQHYLITTRQLLLHWTCVPSTVLLFIFKLPLESECNTPFLLPPVSCDLDLKRKRSQ